VKSGETRPSRDGEKRLRVVLAYFEALRAEILQRMSLRSHVLGIKIAFLSAVCVYLLAGESGPVVAAVAVFVPAASLLFDCLYLGEELGIAAIAEYFAQAMEPELARDTSLKQRFLWETYLRAYPSPLLERAAWLRKFGVSGLSGVVVVGSAAMAWETLTANAWLGAAFIVVYATFFGYIVWVQFGVARRPRHEAEELDLEDEPGHADATTAQRR